MAHLKQPAKFVEPNAYETLQEAIASFRKENSYAAPNRFEISIRPPGTLLAGQEIHDEHYRNIGKNAGKVSLRCESVNLPGRNLNTLTDLNIYGPSREVVNGVTYADDVTMTFQASSGLDERIFFERWQELVFSEKTWNIGYYKDYIGDVDIYLLNKQDQRQYGIRLKEAFPKTINATELNQNTNNEIIKTTVSFSFRYWTTLDQTRSEGPEDSPMGKRFEDYAQQLRRGAASNHEQ